MTQTDANRRWQQKHPDYSRYLNKRSTARNFIKKLATQEDLEELKGLIPLREAQLAQMQQERKTQL